MITAALPMLHSPSRLIIWLVGVSFVLFQFFLQLSSGVVLGAIMHDMHLSALTIGFLGSSFYVVYTCLQLPVGILFDNKNTRLLLASNALLCSIGCLLFASSHTLMGLFVGRALIGMGSAFAFIGLAHLLRQYFPLQKFGFLFGLSETLAFLVTAVSMFGMGALISHWGWRGFINMASLAGVFISFCCWKYIPKQEQARLAVQPYTKQLIVVLKNGTAWINGLFVGLSFNVITVLGALWAIPFIQLKLTCNLREASLIGATLFVGAALSCPLFGVLSARLEKRRPLILCSCISTTLFLLILLFVPITNPILLSFLLFLIGLCCGSYMLAYTIANELVPENARSTSTGFTNMLAVMITTLLQPFIGFLLDWLNQAGPYSLYNYQLALLSIPAALIAASILVCFLPEKNAE